MLVPSLRRRQRLLLLIAVWLAVAAVAAVLAALHMTAVWALVVGGVLAACVPLLATRVDKALDLRGSRCCHSNCLVTSAIS